MKFIATIAAHLSQNDDFGKNFIKLKYTYVPLFVPIP